MKQFASNPRTFCYKNACLLMKFLVNFFVILGVLLRQGPGARGHRFCDFLAVQRDLGDGVPGGVEALQRRAGLPLGHPRPAQRTPRRATPSFHGQFFKLQIECWNLNFGPLAGPVGEEPGDRAAGTDLPCMEAQCVPLLCQRAHHRIVFGCGFYRHVSHPRTAGETFENRITLPTGIFA
jgi:hypothetical protein